MFKSNNKNARIMISNMLSTNGINKRCRMLSVSLHFSTKEMKMYALNFSFSAYAVIFLIQSPSFKSNLIFFDWCHQEGCNMSWCQFSFDSYQEFWNQYSIVMHIKFIYLSHIREGIFPKCAKLVLFSSSILPWLHGNLFSCACSC